MTLAAYSKRLSGDWTRKPCRGCNHVRTMAKSETRCGQCKKPTSSTLKERVRLPGLKRVREEAKVSQSLLVEQVRLYRMDIWRLENEGAKASIETAEALADALCVPVWDLEHAS